KVSDSPPRVTAVKAPVVSVAQGLQGKCNGLGPKKNLTILFLVKSNPQHALKDEGVIDSGCSRYMTGNMSYLFDFEELNGGYVAFGGNPKGGKISGKGKIKADIHSKGIILADVDGVIRCSYSQNTPMIF
nr:ribonuclease H-like domain-containing protein [Tanacetum cinerariifolium]